MAKTQSLKRSAGGGGGFRSTLYIILAIIVLAGVYALAFVITDGNTPQSPAAPRQAAPAAKPTGATPALARAPAK